MLKKEVYELTNPQKNIWQLEQINEKNSRVNHIFATMKLKGKLDPTIMDKTINKILELNDSFRIKFIENDNHLSQYIEDYTYTPTDIVTLQSDDISEYLNYYDNLEVNLKKLYSISIVLTPNYTFVFYKSHHIIVDGWGMTQFAEQVKEIYNKFLNNESFDEYIKPSYIDLVKREEEYFYSQKYISDREFWNNYVTKLNSQKLFSHDTNTQANRIDYPLEYDLSDNIALFCKNHGITEYAFFLGVFFIYFHKIHSLDSLVLGTPFLNRQKRRQELDGTGLYISTLPLNICIGEENSFIELCKNITASNLSIFRHSSFPYEEIQKLYHTHSNSVDKLYEIGFSYQINKFSSLSAEDDVGVCDWRFLNAQNNPLTIHLSAVSDNMKISYDYLLSCFSQEQIDKMHSIIMHIISQLIDSNCIEISNLSVLTASDIENIEHFNHTGDVPQHLETINNVFDKIVQEYGDEIAIICGEKTITYTEFSKKVNTLAHQLLKLGVKPDDPIALFFDKSIDMIVSMFAVLKAGGAYVPILPDENLSRINYILSDCKPKCILTHQNYDSKIFEHIEIINLDKIDLDKEQPPVSVAITPQNLAYIIYTSGSTGNPKGTMVTHKNVTALRYSLQTDSIFKATNKDVSMSLLKYSFDASGIDIYSSLLFGGKLVLVEKEDELNPEKVLKIIEEWKVTRSFLIPKWIEHISIQDKLQDANLSSLRILGSGGEILKPYILENLLSKYSNLKVLNLYGPTEATMFTTCKIISVYEIKNNYTSIGRPIFGSRIAIINQKNDFMPINTEGELIIYEDEHSIHNIAKGYLNLPEQTNKKFCKIYHPILQKDVLAYKTGDIAKINKNLELEFLGRTDDVVKINGGYLVALNEVEKRISSILGSNFQICTVAVPFKNTKILFLFLTKEDKNISMATIQNHINSNISFYMRPKKIIELEEFPRNASGKIDHKKLQQLAEDYLAESKNNLILPRTKTEKEIYEILKSLTNVEDISITDDFIDDLGIDSLALTTIYSSLQSYDLTIQDLYNYSSIKDLATYIDEHKSYNISPDLSRTQEITIQNDVKKFDMKNVLLTGVTGFLGIHLLHDLLLNKSVEKIYCIVRNKINENGQKRLEHVVNHYFASDPSIVQLIDEKVVILNADITKKFFGLDKKDYLSLQETVTTVINSAANVKHFIKPSQIRKDNVSSVNNIIEFCGTNISLAHISTLSIAGFQGKDTLKQVFDENTLYIGQEFNNNPYLITKFEAEKNILIAKNEKELNAIIFRLGNIMPRAKDGIFQENYDQNVFLSSLNTILKIGAIAKEFDLLKIEFSPVDECSKMILSLLEYDGGNSIYHILSNKELSIFDFKILLKELNYDIIDIDFKTFTNMLEKTGNQYTKEYILSNNLNEYSQEKTLDCLNKLNLEWSDIDINYLEKIINIIKNRFY